RAMPTLATSESDPVNQSDPRRDARMVLIGIALGIDITFAQFVVGTAFPWLLGSATRALHVFVSPDGEHRLVITQKARLGGIDPPVDLWMNLEDVRTGVVVDQLIVGVDEDSDVGDPSAEWSPEAVVVRNLEREHNVSATLRR